MTKKGKNTNTYTVLLLIFYAWILLEGVFRKWITPGLATPLFFVKYIIIIMILGVFILNREKLFQKDYPFIGIYFFFVFFCFLQLFNLYVTNTPVLPVIGAIIYLGFSILMFAIPKAFFTIIHIKRFFQKLNFLLIPIFILGITQYFSPIDSFINQYSKEDMDIATVGDHVRITTLFSYIGPYTSFLNFILLILFFQILQLKKYTLGSLLTITAFLLGTVNAFMTGSRGLVFLTLIQFFLVILSLIVTNPSQHLVRIVLTLLLLGSLILVILNYTEEGNIAYQAFASRVEKNHDMENRVMDAFSPFKFLDRAGFIGFGSGTTYQGAQQFITKRYLMPVYWEEESERIVLELGLVGFIILFLLRLMLFIHGVKIFFNLNDAWLKCLVLMVLVHQSPALLFLNQATFNWMENITYWTGVGLLVCIHKIYSREQKKAASVSVAYG